ncbi:MAG: hypothetical protein OEW60_03955 [Thiovulaceae bacterium]|nr:hypothetical protein [Sulfurimonadaceae bacterium]
MRASMFDEKINLVKSLNGAYKLSDKEMVVSRVDEYKKINNCSYRHAYDMTVEGNPSFSAYSSWRRKSVSKSV